MAKYPFKEFEISYEIRFSDDLKYYEALGNVIRIENDQETFSKEFRTEASTHQSAEEEIKRLMEEFVDFEWHQFKIMKEDPFDALKMKPFL